MRPMRLTHHALSFALLLLPAAAQQPARPHPPQPHAPEPETALPVTSVSLYKNGVGYFEHTGRVTGDGQVSIDFTSAQLNDVLQSLTAIDLNGGHIAAAGYNSTTPLDQQLKTLPFTLGEETTASDFYTALRGARVTVSSPGAVSSGRLLAVEVRSTATGGDDTKPSIEHNFITVASDSGDVRTLELTGATTVRLLDPTLQRSVNRYLQLVESNRSQGLRHLTLTDNGTGTREVRVSYISEVPVWKSTYRILFTPSTTPSTTNSATLQGWSVVDNTTGADWIDVHLSLIAGAPQSFIQPLSQPIYTRRPEIPIATEAQLSPQTFDSSMDAPPPTANETVTVNAQRVMAAPRMMAKSEMRGNYVNGVSLGMASGSGSGVGPGAGGYTGGGILRQGSYADLAAASLSANTTTSAFDDFFSYTLDSPVTILKNQSALVPILQTKIPADSVTLVSYNGSRVSQPLRALWLTNSSTLTLDRGSFTVIEGSNFAGEGLLDPVHPGEKRLVSYAADQAVHASTEGDKTTNHVTTITASRGIVHLQHADIHEATVVLHNAAPTRRSVVSEFPVVNGWKLDSLEGRTDDPKPVETTATVYRFRSEVDPGATVRLHVGARHVGENLIYLTNSNEQQLATIVQQSGDNAQVRAALAPILDARRRVADAQTALDQTNARLTALRADEDRQRANITALAGADKTARERFVNDLNKTEDAITAAQTELTTRTAALDVAKADLASKIDNLNLDVPLGAS